MVEYDIANVKTGVRFSLPAPSCQWNKSGLSEINLINYFSLVFEK